MLIVWVKLVVMIGGNNKDGNMFLHFSSRQNDWSRPKAVSSVVVKGFDFPSVDDPRDITEAQVLAIHCSLCSVLHSMFEQAVLVDGRRPDADKNLGQRRVVVESSSKPLF